MAAKTLMIQGTGSGVGKSVITAAFCRKFYLDGLRVAPFKAQNMSLNSFVTEEGGEMGRAQAYQAEACGIKPHVAMNPVLLKPSADNMSQVIVMGKARGNRDARNYYSERGKHIDAVREAFDYLRTRYDLIVLEGAGSPAEINLKEFDFVNMRMAKMASAPVLIAGDIDRGGVFAWMKGTYDLLDDEEKKMVKGFIINKFRGDINLLKPGIAMFEDMVQKPVVGVIPFCRDLYVDEEDCIPVAANPAVSSVSQPLEAAVIRLPRISNFTDFSPLAHDPSISLRYVWLPEQLWNADLIILPGSKNTLADLHWLKSQGLLDAVRECHRKGAVVLGVCGGFQMLGKAIRDPHRTEGNLGEDTGLGLLKLETTMLREKTTKQASLSTCDSPIFEKGLNATGYEIHMGITKFNAAYPALFLNGDAEHPLHSGVSSEDGMVIGTYIHGFLDNDDLRRDFLKHIRNRRGLPHPDYHFEYKEFREKQLNRLAKMIETHIDMKQVNAMIQNAC